MRRSRPQNSKEFQTPSPPAPREPSPPLPVEPIVLDWGLLSATPSCCVCGEVYLPPFDEHDNIGISDSDNADRVNRRSRGRTALFKGQRQHGGAADESFVVLPESTPVLSESYFSLPRNTAANTGAAIPSMAVTDDSTATTATHTTQATTHMRGRDMRVPPRMAGSGMAGSTSSGAPGSELLESGYGSGLGGWTGSGFGGGSSMLESIVQISHAGLSDNVKRESLLHELSRRPARLDGSDSPASERRPQDTTTTSPGETHAGGPSNDDPTLCCHCYASLLERIEGDTRQADKEALAYRDFVDLLDGIVAEGVNNAANFPRARDRDNGTDTRGKSKTPEGLVGVTAAVDGGAAPPRRSERPEKIGTDSEERREDYATVARAGRRASRETQSSPFAQALQMAEQTSMQLRTELQLLETQREALCVRGSKAWAALSELAYARGLLGDECRELLQASREVAGKAAELADRSALSDLFSIRHMDGFPSINGYRLGRAPDDKRQLQWNEINAAWGEAVLLVRCVSNAVNFRSSRFRLVPLNCSSRVIELFVGDGEQSREDADGDDDDYDTGAGSIRCAHGLFNSSARKGEDKLRLLGAMRAFVICSSEVIACVESRVLEQRLDGEMSAGAACVAWSDVGLPYKQSDDTVGGVSITSLKSSASWKAWLCQLVKNLEWAVGAAASLCVS